MKNSSFILAGVVGLTVFFIQEFRISQLKTESSTTDSTVETKNSHSNSSPTPSGAPTKSQERLASSTLESENSIDKSTSSDAVKKMAKLMDSDAGRAQMERGLEMSIALTYDDFIESLDLSADEEAVFRDLLLSRMRHQQRIGMQLMSADGETREELSDELVKVSEEDKAKIKEFLNSDEDWNSLETYETQIPERQQLPGIRSALKESPLDPEKEIALVEALSTARLNSTTLPVDSTQQLIELSSGKNYSSSLTQQWKNEDIFLNDTLPNILDPSQLDAFRAYLEQARDLQLMQMEMMEKHLAPSDE